MSLGFRDLGFRVDGSRVSVFGLLGFEVQESTLQGLRNCTFIVLRGVWRLGSHY